MAVMLAKTYAAFRAAGAPEAAAQAAAEELADYETRLAAIDTRLGRVEAEIVSFRSEVKSRFAVLTWAIGVNAAATIAILGVLLRH
jgi:hypothetical protein